MNAGGRLAEHRVALEQRSRGMALATQIR